ncbi:hypothetical protein Tco_1447134 [Tanacetum coccineum]
MDRISLLCSGLCGGNNKLPIFVDSVLFLIKEQIRIRKDKAVSTTYTLRASCGELDAQPSPPDEGVMTFLRKKVKTGAVVGKRVLLQVLCSNFEGWKLDGISSGPWAFGFLCVVCKNGCLLVKSCDLKTLSLSVVFKLMSCMVL